MELRDAEHLGHAQERLLLEVERVALGRAARRAGEALEDDGREREDGAGDGALDALGDAEAHAGEDTVPRPSGEDLPRVQDAARVQQPP